MKLIINISIFIFVLLIPFALSSQTRKAIPAGRYEALSGIKVSRSNKGEIVSVTSKQVNIWQEVQKNLPVDKNEFLVLKNHPAELDLSQLVPNKTFKEVSSFEKPVDLLITSNLETDKSKLKHLKSKGLIVLISKIPIKDLMISLSPYELLAYVTSASSENYYLLKTK